MEDEVVELLKYRPKNDIKVCPVCEVENDIGKSICYLCGSDLKAPEPVQVEVVNENGLYNKLNEYGIDISKVKGYFTQERIMSLVALGLLGMIVFLIFIVVILSNM